MSCGGKRERKTYLDALVVQVETGPDSVVECLARLARRVHVANLLALHEPSLAIERGLDNAIPDGLGDNVLGALLGTQVEADADVAKRDAAVAQAHHADARPNDVLPQTENECVGTVTAERVGVIGDDHLKILEVADPYSLDEEEIWVQSSLHRWLPERRTVGDVAHQQLHHKEQLGGSGAETKGASTGGCLSCGRHEVLVGLGVA